MIKRVGQYQINVVDSCDKNKYISDSDEDMDKRAKSAVESSLNKAKVCNKPIAKYNVFEKKAYIEYNDGRKIYVK